MTKLDFLFEQATEGLREPALKTIIEKEIIHHDILRILSEGGFLNRLTFVGGTCLRLIYGSSRYSEDLDFTVGMHSLKETELRPMAESLSTERVRPTNEPVSSHERLPENGSE
jgi:predicted nucleotidyltransferase component of viral defense system